MVELLPIRIATLLLTLGLLPADKPWTEKPQDEWTLEDSQAVLWESPWVDHKTFTDFVTHRFFREVRCYARLHSARPIRLAMARLAQLQPGRHLRFAGPVDNDKVLETAESLDTPGEISVTLSCTARGYRWMLEAESFETLSESTYLVLGKEKRKIPLSFYHPPSQTISRDALFRFHRPHGADPLKKEIRFVCTFGDRRKVDLDLKFKIKDLVFEGQLEY